MYIQLFICIFSCKNHANIVILPSAGFVSRSGPLAGGNNNGNELNVSLAFSFTILVMKSDQRNGQLPVEKKQTIYWNKTDRQVEKIASVTLGDDSL